jgi:alginate O-acetyltransferase complex protein AlgJ
VTAQSNEPPIGSEEPLKPKRSLPSYRDPTPETHRKISREEEAELALKNTIFTPGSNTLLIALFLITIASVPVIQLAAKLRASQLTRRSGTFVIPSAPPVSAEPRTKRASTNIWNLFPRAEDLKATEKALENDSVVAQWLLPRVQSVLTGDLHGGNEQVYLGRDGWLFYRADVDYVTSPPFLDPTRMKKRARSAGAQPDAIKAIVDFRNQLAQRGIDLIIVPTPVKPSIDGEMLAALDPSSPAFENQSFSEFKARLTNEGVHIFDPEPLLVQNKTSHHAPLYLKADTHWRPETMEFIAGELAREIKLPAPARAMTLQAIDKKINALGDLARMLKLSPAETSRHREEVTIRQVTSANGTWRSNKDADVLLLGDSFSNIFSLEGLGWGESAGFAEHLSRALQGRPLDCILRNSDGAFATREILAHDLARGRDRLAGKKLVVWEFATRELAFGNWKLLDLTLRSPAPSHFLTPQPNQEIVVTGTVDAISSVPRPGSAPYADHIIALHLVDVSGPARRGDEQCLVYLWSMRNYTLTAAAHLRPGDRVHVRLRPWADVSAQYEKISRSDLDDPALQLEEPTWGELETESK